MGLYHKHDHKAFIRIRALKFACINGKADEKDQADHTRTFEDIGKSYKEKKWKEVIEKIDHHSKNSFGWEREYLYYVRAQAIVQRFLSKEIDDLNYASLKLESLPVELQDYFKGIFYYSHDAYELAYHHFSIARFFSAEFVNSMWGFVDSSIRGVNSAISFSQLDRQSQEHPDTAYKANGFEILKTPTKARFAHVIGCDKNYFEKFYESFYRSFRSVVGKDVVLWVHVSNPDEATIERLKEIQDDLVGIAIDKATYKNIKTYYTIMRFMLGNYLADNFEYEKLCFSDIDVDLKPSYIELVSSNYDFIIKKIDRGVYPWRSVDAKFVVINVFNRAAKKFILENMVRHFLNVYKDDLDPRGNKQWWVDQYSLAVISDALISGKADILKINYKFILPKEIPVITAEDMKMSREEFSRRS